MRCMLPKPHSHCICLHELHRHWAPLGKASANNAMPFDVCVVQAASCIAISASGSAITFVPDQTSAADQHLYLSSEVV